MRNDVVMASSGNLSRMKPKPKLKLKADVFERVPEFLSAFDNICTSGFFEEMEVRIGGEMMEGKVFSIKFKATGCIPSHAMYWSDGCGTLVSPTEIIATVRRTVEKRPVRNILVEVKTENWNLVSPDGQEYVGSKGIRTTMSCFIQFE